MNEDRSATPMCRNECRDALSLVFVHRVYGIAAVLFKLGSRIVECEIDSRDAHRIGAEPRDWRARRSDGYDDVWS